MTHRFEKLYGQRFQANFCSHWNTHLTDRNGRFVVCSCMKVIRLKDRNLSCGKTVKRFYRSQYRIRYKWD